jgi:hypothetical protein
MTNELGDEIPPEIEEAARQLRCAGGVRYVYLDDEYGGGFPAASVGLSKATRFGSTRYEKHKKLVGESGGTRHVAFESPSRAPRLPLAPIPVDEIPQLPDARQGEETNTFAINDTPLVFRVVDGFMVPLPHNPIKAFCVQLLEVDDGGNFARSHRELRIAYYMVAHKGRRRGTWAFGQFAPMLTPSEYLLIHQEIERRGWLTAPDPSSVAPDSPAPEA